MIAGASLLAIVKRAHAIGKCNKKQLQGSRALSRQCHHATLISPRSGRGECRMSVSSNVYLRGLIPHGDHGQLITRQAAYALAIGTTANTMFVYGATAMLLAFAL